MRVAPARLRSACLAAACFGGCSFSLDLDGPPESTLGCVPVAEACNGVDDDCDTLVDEDLFTACYDGPRNTDGVAHCRAGRARCIAVPGSLEATYGKCEGQVLPDFETCNGIDDDCDGDVDSSSGEVVIQPCYTFDEGTPDVGRCRSGWAYCEDGEFGLCTDDVGPRDESDNDIDDDCDGRIDE